MIHRIFGRSGYGKSEYLYEIMRERLKKNPDKKFDIVLIVPEQETVTIERRIVEKFGNESNFRIDPLNFSRMINRISRDFGGVIYDYADSTVKKLVMNSTLKLLEPSLEFYGKVYDNTDFVDTMVRTIDEMRLWLITPLMLEDASKIIFDGGDNNNYGSAEAAEISKKLKEIGIIYSAYATLFNENENLCGIQDEMMYLYKLLDKSYEDNGINNGEENGVEKAKKAEKYFFSDKCVFIDSFDSFTHGQKLVLSKIFMQAEDVYITFKCPLDVNDGEEAANVKTEKRTEKRTYEEENIFYKQTSTAEFVASLCREHSLPRAPDVILTEPKRFRNDVLASLEKNLWKDKKVFDYSDGELRDKLEIYECDNIFAETETVAKKILCLVREKNYRYRDIKIVASDISLYGGILDSVFEKYGIPLFMSKRTKLSVKPLTSMILGLFDIAVYDFKLPHIQGYIKNGLCNLDLDEIDDFSLYITSWQLNGSRRYISKDWNMHPDGYVEYSQDDAYIHAYLARINEIRRKFAEPIKIFIDDIEKLTKENKCTVRNITVALINFLESQKIYDRLYELQTEQKKSGEYAEAAETVQIWNILMELFQKIVLVSGDETVELKKYAEIFRFILDDIDIGKIPTSIDEVTAQNADLMRDGNTKCTIVLGVNADIFPKAIIDNDLFNDFEKRLLKSHGIEFSEDCIQKSFDQLYYFYNAATSSSERVIFMYSRAGLKGEAMSPSPMIEKICAMYPNLEIAGVKREVPAGSEYDFMNYDFMNIEGKENGFFEMNFTDDKLLKIALEKYFRDDDEYGEYAKMISGHENKINAGFKEQEIFIDKNMADKLFYNQNTSSTRLESYTNCHFGYFCNYVLKLKAPKRPSIQLTDIGKFIHKILELFMLKIKNENLQFNAVSNDFIKKTCEELIKEYLEEVIKDYEYKSDRFKYLLRRLNKIIFEIVKNLRDEFSSCDFFPADFELDISDNKEGGVNPVVIDIPGKGTMKVTGIVDRVDAYRKNGNVYIRIVDYKTGSKKFKFSDILMGLNLQMLIYLFSIWQNGGNKYTNNQEKVIPAGVLYMPSKISPYEKTPKMTDKDVEAKKEENFERSGLFLNDREILKSMEHELQGRFIPVKSGKEKNIVFKKNSSVVLASLEQIGKLRRYVEKTLASIATELAEGNASAKPFKGKTDSCVFCEMRSICRYENNDGHRKTIPSLKVGKVWDIIDGDAKT